MRWKPYLTYKPRDDGTYETVVAPHTFESDAGYSVLRCTTEGVPTGRYIAFVGRFGSKGFRVLKGCDSAEEARAICEAHLAQTQETTAA